MKQTTDSTSQNGHTYAASPDNSNYSKEGVLKKETGDETIPNLGEGKQLITREKIEGLPFEIIHQEEIGYWLGMGVCRLTKPVDARWKIEELMGQTNWELVINIIGAIMIMNEMKETPELSVKDII